MENRFNVGDPVRHISDCVTSFKVKNVYEEKVNFFYDIISSDLLLEKIPEHELSFVVAGEE